MLVPCRSIGVTKRTSWAARAQQTHCTPQSQSAYALQIHWFSIVNSCVTVLLLTGFLATILMRVLKNDFIKYTQDDEEGEGHSRKCSQR